jgi:hypothetical protein
MDAYVGCMYYYTNEFDLCRKEQQAFEKACPLEWLANGTSNQAPNNLGHKTFCDEQTFCVACIFFFFLWIVSFLVRSDSTFKLLSKESTVCFLLLSMFSDYYICFWGDWTVSILVSEICSVHENTGVWWTFFLKKMRGLARYNNGDTKCEWR